MKTQSDGDLPYHGSSSFILVPNASRTSSEFRK